MFAVDRRRARPRVVGDGDVDTVVASYWASKVVWIENVDENRTFSTHAGPDCEGCARVAAGDVDGDGSVDFAAVSWTDSILYWMKNDGAQTFEAVVIDDQSITNHYDADIADMDGDADRDILYALISSNEAGYFNQECVTDAPTTSLMPTALPTARPSAAPTSNPTHSECVRGTYSKDLTSAACAPCEKGKYVNATGATACAVCPVNTFAGSFGSTTCDACPAGRQSGLAAESCNYCLAGEYETLDEGGNRTCIPCANGTYSPLGLYCLSCGAGYATADAISCAVCGSGSFSSGLENSACDLCPAGTYSSAGASDCAACEAGRSVRPSLFFFICSRARFDVLRADFILPRARFSAGSRGVSHISPRHRATPAGTRRSPAARAARSRARATTSPRRARRRRSSARRAA